MALPKAVHLTCWLWLVTHALTCTWSASGYTLCGNTISNDKHQLLDKAPLLMHAWLSNRTVRDLCWASHETLNSKWNISTNDCKLFVFNFILLLNIEYKSLHGVRWTLNPSSYDNYDQLTKYLSLMLMLFQTPGLCGCTLLTPKWWIHLLLSIW